jgi:hypothetical protein
MGLSRKLLRGVRPPRPARSSASQERDAAPGHRFHGGPATEVASVFRVSRQAFDVTETAFNGRASRTCCPRPRSPQRDHGSAGTSPEGGVNGSLRSKHAATSGSSLLSNVLS